MPSRPISAIELRPKIALIAPNDMPPPIMPSDNTDGIVIKPATTAHRFAFGLLCHDWSRLGPRAW